VVDPLTVPLIAMTSAFPAASAVATPFCDITITDGFELCHVTDAPGMAAPFASRAVAVACAV
jgi:hypothetical protein